MASPLELSMLSINVYNKPLEQRQGFGNFVPMGKGINNEETGLRMQAYINKETNEVVIASAGTNELKDHKTNSFFVTGDEIKLPKGYKEVQFAQFKEAMDYVNQLKSDKSLSQLDPKPTFIVTGHSLGGGISQVLAHTFNLKGVTFDAPAASAIIESDIFKKHAKTLEHAQLTTVKPNQMINYTEAYSLVSSVDTIDPIKKRQYVGKEIELDTKSNELTIGGAISTIIPGGKALKVVGGVILWNDQFGEKGQHAATRFADYFMQERSLRRIEGYELVHGALLYPQGEAWYSGQPDEFYRKWSGKADEKTSDRLFTLRRAYEKNNDFIKDYKKSFTKDDKALEHYPEDLKKQTKEFFTDLQKESHHQEKKDTNTQLRELAQQKKGYLIAEENPLASASGPNKGVEDNQLIG
jgi:hypothetical protein